MIDDKQTCDVCGEEFNEDRPHHEHPAPEKKPEGATHQEETDEEEADEESEDDEDVEE